VLLLEAADVVVGADRSAALQLVDPAVSGRHALIRQRCARYTVRDLKSQSGTYLNGRRVRRTRRLAHGDQLRFGSTRYRFIDPDGHARLHRRRIAVAAELTLLVAGVGYGLWHLGDLGAEFVTPAVESQAAPPAAANTQANRASDGAAAAEPAWLRQLNHYRAMAGVGALHEAAEISAADTNHARYLFANFAAQLRDGAMLGDAAYQEDPARPGYTADGAHVARDSQLAWGCGPYDSGTQIDRWFAGPFHRLTMLDPSIAEAGFGEATSGNCWVAAIRFPPVGDVAKAYQHAIEFPPDGSTVGLEFVGGEFPDPLASCPGYSMPVGLPITLQLGHLIDVNLTAHSLTRDGAPVEHCGFEKTTYQNPNSNAQEYGRWALRQTSAAVLIPRAPLRAGCEYAVSVTADGQTYRWKFRVSR